MAKKKRKLGDVETLVLLVETVGGQRASQLLGVAALAVVAGADNVGELRQGLVRMGLCAESTSFRLMADWRRFRQALQKAEGQDPGDVWSLMQRVGRLRPDLRRGDESSPGQGLTAATLTC